MTDPRAHWERVYREKRGTEVSWFRPHLDRSLRLIERAGLPPGARIVDVGGGASTLVDDLLARGFRTAVLDVSGAALAVARARLGARAADVEWIEADATRAPLPAAGFDLWHDRAVFHFLVDPADRRRYVEAAARAVRPGGFLVVATFALDGPSRCSGLEVARYDAAGLAAAFDGFDAVEDDREVHRTPWGAEQAFTYIRMVRRVTGRGGPAPT